MALTLISTPLDITTSDTPVSTVDITSGIDDTYPVYEIHYVGIHPETDNTEFQFQVETGSDSDYDHPMITTYFQAHNDESGGSPTVAYSTGDDQATAGDGNGVFQTLAKDVGAGEADQSTSGILTLYDPSSAYVKHFISTSNCYQGGDTSVQTFVSGYINITTAITRVQFKMSSDTIHAGTIKMFGVS